MTCGVNNSMVLGIAIDHGRTQLGRECYPRGNCVASELGRKHSVGQIKCQLDFCSIILLPLFRINEVCSYSYKCCKRDSLKQLRWSIKKNSFTKNISVKEFRYVIGWIYLRS